MNLTTYIARRILAVIPTLLLVSLLTFLLINLAPGGPVEQALQRMKFSQGSQSMAGAGGRGQTDSAVTQEVIESLKRQYGFDKPIMTRYWIWLTKLARFDFGDSFIYHDTVLNVIVSKFSVSLTFGLVSFFIAYIVSIPLGILKAVWNGSRFDVVSSFLLFLTYSIPAFMLGILLIVFLGPGGLGWFPLQGIHSDIYDALGGLEKLWDRIHHAILPLICYCIGSFATLTVLMKNSVLEEVKRDYVRTARAKGLGERTVILKHVLRNALIPIATGLGSLFSVFFAGSILIEAIFGLDGMGLLSFNSTLQRDYNVVMGLLMIETLTALVGNLASDLLYVFIDPRLDFAAVNG